MQGSGPARGLPPEELNICMAQTGCLSDPEVYRRLFERLPRFRREKAETIRAEETRYGSVAAFSLLLHALERAELDMRAPSVWEELGFRVTEKGKPYFAGAPGIRFSLSHTRGAVLCAVSGTEVGCDIEDPERKTDVEKLAHMVLSEQEKGCTDRPDFFRIWTRKEAYSKYTGNGLAENYAGFAVDEAPVASFAAEHGGYVCAVCSPLCTVMPAIRDVDLVIL